MQHCNILRHDVATHWAAILGRIDMATRSQVGNPFRDIFAVSVVALLIAGMASSTQAQETPGESPDQALSKMLIDDVAGQIEKFCKARKVRTLQVGDFRGTVGARANADVKRDWLDSLKERGIAMRDIDSTLISGRIVTQQSGDVEIILLKCTLSDSRGAEIRTFRVRKVVTSEPLS